MTTATSIEVRNAYSGEVAGTVPDATVEEVDRAVGAAAAAALADWPSHERYDVLMRAAALVDRHADDYAGTIAREGSKAIREARREPPRAANILRLSAEEGRRLAGETLPFDSRVGSENRAGYFFRVPLGVIAAITPFNDPLAIAAHKIGPALAAGNAVVLKPASLTPLSAVRLAGHLREAGLPDGRLAVITGRGSAIGDALVSDRRVRMVAFTGGIETGERITRLTGIKKLMMELGSNSPVIVNADADLAKAVPAIAAGAFAQAGQNCLGVQRVFGLQPVYERFRDAFVAHVRTLNAGASTDDRTDVCPMITEAQAARVEAWVEEARAGGARVLAGGRRDRALVWPTVLENVPAGARVDRQEVYGPVVSLCPVGTLDEAIARANDVEYGIHAAIFTESLRDAFEAVRRLQAGAVIVNDSTDYRLDVMPFGGTKLSGIGREGIRHSLLEMTEPRVVCLNL
ncbi:MAG TPA: aldehyde dehydrogenase family protein [Vicinamibacterales bacterium]|nr:aldehyde dehydrogenase family protein [Vicinamibacterales bacterium]